MNKKTTATLFLVILGLAHFARGQSAPAQPQPSQTTVAKVASLSKLVPQQEPSPFALPKQRVDQKTEAGTEVCFGFECDATAEEPPESIEPAEWDVPLSHLIPQTDPSGSAPYAVPAEMDLPDPRLVGGRDSSGSINGALRPGAPLIPIPGQDDAKANKVQWWALTKGSLRYLLVMQSFRLLTETEGTRYALGNSVVGGYFKALGAMHGWSDGDGYYENYLGHPIQGSVSSFLWIHNDKLRYRNVEFGKSRDYWMSRLRAYAFAWAFSVQFEIGPISEATLGQIQRYCCAYGFVDHIITPNAGMVWVVGEDIVDKYVIRRLEDRTNNLVGRAAARVWLNPVQSFANLMNLEWPWYRENRGPLRDGGTLYSRFEPEEKVQTEFPVVPKFEIAATVPSVMRYGNLSCLGGGGVAGFRVTDSWQWTLEVSGCTLGNSLPKNWSGDSLTWTTGPQWIRHTESRWSPHAHFRIGGQKITEKQVDPTMLKWIGGPPPPLAEGEANAATKHWESTGLSMAMGGGVDVRLNAALAWRFASFDYVRSWVGQLNGVNFDRGFRFTTGVVLRLGTW